MISTTWLIAGGVGLATVLGLLWATSGTANAAEKKTNTEKNKEAGGAAFATGKAAGYSQGGIDAATSGAEDIDPGASAEAKAASAKTDDPPSFLKGWAEGYPAGFAASAAAKKLGATYGVSMADEPPPPPDAPPATPPGKPKDYSSAPNTAGFNLAYGEGHTYGKNNALDYAPGGSQANGLKTSDQYAASKKFDMYQMTLWSSSWDKGYQRGWDQGQAEYHAGVGGGGGGITKDTTEVTVDKTDEGEGFLSTTGVAGSPRSAPLLSVGMSLGVGSVGTILSVGYEPATSTLLRVGGARVLGIRGPYSPPIIAARRKFGTTRSPGDKARADYNEGERQGGFFCERYHADASDRQMKDVTGQVIFWSSASQDAENIDRILRGYHLDRGWRPSGKTFSEDYKRGFYAGKEACEKKYAKGWSSSRAPGMPMRGISQGPSMSMFNYGG